MTDQVAVAVTGLAWMGSGIGSIESSVERVFREAQHDVSITAYAVSMGADIVFENLDSSLARGIAVRMAVNKLYVQPAEVIARLLKLNEVFPHFHLFTFQGAENQDLHAKVILADRNAAVVGSSNLSHRGLLGNHELALVVQGPICEGIGFALDRLFSSPELTEVHP